MIASKLAFVIVTLAATALAPCAVAQHQDAATAPTASQVSIELHAPRPGLYTAGQPAPSDWSAIEAKGVRTVINLRPDSELEGRDVGAEVRAAGMTYHQIPVAGVDGITAENASRLSVLLDDAEGPVLVHCSTANRVGGLLAIAAAQEGMDADAALAFGRSAGMKSAEARVREVLNLPPAR
jgi:uncharacterized protein (TIGR01244 family)